MTQNDLISIANGQDSLTFANGRQGEQIFIVGHPGVGEYKMTKSTIGSIRGESDKLVSMTAKVLSPGNSGGPVLNSKRKSYRELTDSGTGDDSSERYFLKRT